MCTDCWRGVAGPEGVGPRLGRGSLVVPHPTSAATANKERLSMLQLQPSCARNVSASALPDGSGGSSGGSVPGAEGSGDAAGPSGRDATSRPRTGADASRDPNGHQVAMGSEGEGTRSAGASGSAEAGAQAGAEAEPPPSLGVRTALSMLAFYRNVMSPLMPSTCRFLPSCSNYSIESYKKFGVIKGSVLTAWRLMRCNPWGGRGYDPPAWPPVGLEAVYAVPYTPEITVVGGVWLAYWFVASTIDSIAW
ncbi:hypothetical protein CHLRE_17g720183v5 [Chlamydomonas reinhardtii]|uniref:Membrane protein insertion efficiency factor n=1 Tax=Chlamydomonas reinhardtii TaxID=3055 RepID=A0A2K3CQ86_CHLRE|nr:uncharacterized protein CHLRE_17g720183v5 [Chlamydomonas reinhardtii]PNW70447.1 hypothetical protein CHLRE_17g720183v5 [Chlamydomonas reinhardtii]